MTVSEAFGDVADILARLNPAQVLKLHAPSAMAERVEELIDKKKEGSINWEESIELERYLALDLLIGLTKVRARRLVEA